MQDGNAAATPTSNLLDGVQNMDAALLIAQGLLERAVDFLPNVVGAILVFIIGMWLAGRVRALAQSWFERSSRLDATLESFLSSFIYYAVVVLVVITTLGIFGVQTTSLAAVVGAAGLAVGLALQGTLGHLASGVMLLAFRPFKIGDYIQAAGLEGSVRAITLFTTELATADNKKIIMPNSEVWSSSIVNFSAYDTRRVDLVFGVSYGDDLNKAVTLIKDEVGKEKRGLASPEAVVAVDNLGDSSVDIICRVWVNASDYFPVKWALTQAVKERFDAEGIEIPFPTTTVVRSAA
ncbi:MAG: mechanosensitive ion channel domain-containing protein [Pseudomonadota bacterium]